MSIEKDRYELEEAYQALEAVRGDLADLDNALDDLRDEFLEKGAVTYDESDEHFEKFGIAVVAMFDKIDAALKGYAPRRPNPEKYYTDFGRFKQGKEE